MTAPTPPPGITLAVHPTARGFGWAALTGPLAAYDSGLFDATKDKNVVCLKKVGTLLEELQPETLVLEAFERRNSARTDRIASLGRALVALAADRGIDCAIYSRQEIRRCFETVGARTRHEIAEAVARHLPSLAYRLPPERKLWNSEDRRMALFAAAALVLTHYRYERSPCSMN